MHARKKTGLIHQLGESATSGSSINDGDSKNKKKHKLPRKIVIYSLLASLLLVCTTLSYYLPFLAAKIYDISDNDISSSSSSVKQVKKDQSSPPPPPTSPLELHLAKIRTEALLPASLSNYTILKTPNSNKGQYCSWSEINITNNRCDLQLLFKRLIARIPFSYAHFNDGEILAMTKTSGMTDRGLQTLSEELQVAITTAYHREAPGLVFGIPCKQEFKDGNKYAMEQLGESSVERTIATLFINSNYKDARALLLEYLKRNPDRNVHLVVSDAANIDSFTKKTGIHPTTITKIPSKEAFPKGYNDNIHNTTHHLPDDIVILCAGPLGRILSVEWFVQRPQTTYLELGSFFDKELLGKSLGADYYDERKYKPKRSHCGSGVMVQTEMMLDMIDRTATDRFVL